MATARQVIALVLEFLAVSAVSAAGCPHATVICATTWVPTSMGSCVWYGAAVSIRAAGTDAWTSDGAHGLVGRSGPADSRTTPETALDGIYPIAATEESVSHLQVRWYLTAEQCRPRLSLAVGARTLAALPGEVTIHG
jgi:hypothetical protein